ncbi:hypothetical protein LWI29_018944 [Acer saccharum]|uniref:Uncharacterized protein n=1 Tax=Acer saccharum TaxID=4024 RepID=A0AA39SLD8_ACESA|nr:hypothetical protein LWI29_018944 [Acer saccharum]
MINLRLLQISNVDLSEDLEYLSNELRYLEWHGYPSNSLPSNFHPRKLFALDLCYSRIKYLWKGMETFERLKTIKLSYSHNLIETPDFTWVPNLEMLDLKGCTRLRKVHDSVGLLERLTILNLKGCKNLVSFPSNVSRLLKILNLQGCSKLDHLPQNLGELEVLEELDAGETAIRQVPPSIARLSNLRSLSFSGCKVQSWWSWFLPRKYLNSMCLSLPRLSGLSSLITLDLSDSGLSDGSLPSDLGSLCSLKELQSLPELPPEIVFVRATDCISLEDVSNALRGSTSKSFALHLFNCLKLHENLGQENNLAIVLLKQYLQQPVNLSFDFHIRLPGFDIPEWFSCKNDGNSVKIGLPPDWLNDDFMGIAMCGVFEPALENLDCSVGMRCNISILTNRYCFYFKIPSFTVVESHHLWLAYMSRTIFEYHTSHHVLSYVDPSDSVVRLIILGLVKVTENKEQHHQNKAYATCIHVEFDCKLSKKSTGECDDDNDKKFKGTHEVKSIMLDKSKQRINHLNDESFSSMRNLRLLKIRNVDLSRDIEYLSNELRFLKWPEYPSNSLPSNFQPQKLFELNLCRSRIQYLWKDMKTFERLKTIKLSYSHNLIETPDFTWVPNLEMLDLEGCTRLRKVHDSVGLLERLTILNLKGCKNLVSFPSNVSRLLKILNLQGCSKLDHLPQNLGELEVLEELDAGETAIRQVPPSIARLSNLKSLSFCGCKVQGWRSIFLPRKYLDSMCLSLPCLSGLFSLKSLDLSDSGLSDGSLPSDLGSLCSLKELKLSNNNFVSLPDSIKRLSKLQILYVENCHRLQSLPELPPEITFVRATDCISLEDVSNALRGSTSPWFALHLFNCLKLHENLGQENNLAIVLLKQYLQQPVNPSYQFHIRLPGFDIPEWFSCKNDGNSVEIGLPPDWLNDDFMGIAMCGVFEPALENLDCSVEMRCNISILTNRYGFYFKIPSFTVVESHHLWLAYISRMIFEYHTSPQSLSYFDPSDLFARLIILGLIKVPERIELHHQNKAYATCIHVEFDCKLHKKSTGEGEGDDDNDKKFKVIKCGIRLVYKKDKNYFQESSAAEGSVFHQKDNCSTVCACRECYWSRPDKCLHDK